MSVQRTGPEGLRFLAWELELNSYTTSHRTTSDKLRTYANVWEAENTALKHRLGLCEMALRVAHLPLPPYDAPPTAEEKDEQS